jgi:DNA-directed RNA polymerase beta subunit
MYFSENSYFLDAYQYMKIKPSWVNYLMVPITKKPVTRLVPSLKKLIKSHMLRPVSMQIGEYEKYTNINYYIDMSWYTQMGITKYKLENFSTGKAKKFMDNAIGIANGIPNDTHSRVLMYAINTEKPIPDLFFYKRIFSFYNSIMEGTFPFDYWFIFLYNKDEGKYYKFYEKGQKVDLPRMKSMIMRLNYFDDLVDYDDEEKEKVRKDIIKNVVKHNEDLSRYAPEINTALKAYARVSPDNIVKTDPIKSSSKAVLYHVTRDTDKVEKISERLNRDQHLRVIEKYSAQIVKKNDAIVHTNNPVLRMYDIPKLLENETPEHIYEKRRFDFNEGLEQDITNIFTSLEKKQIPFKVVSLRKDVMRTPVSELNPTIKDRYNIRIADPDGIIHETYIDLPHLTDNGTFLINGRSRILINQMITYPIFFFKPYYGQLSTVYSTLTIMSKAVKAGSYLMIFVGGYKLPMFPICAYKIGFDNLLKLFNIQYYFRDKRPAVDSDNTKTFKIGDNYLTFQFNNEEGQQLVNSFGYALPDIPKDMSESDLKDDEFWRSVVSSMTGTRNSIYILDEVWNNILTPIEVEVLKTHGDPSDLVSIIHYISSKVVQGVVDDRNSLEKQRIRTAEVFAALISKQVNAAYNEYLAKKLGGDENAKFQFNPTKAFSEVITSQNVQLLENINPVEELSMMTRVTPVGIGGIPDKRAITKESMNIHDTYFGNIDPLETPDGPGIGIVQHLSIGTSLASKRGQFAIKDPNMVSGVGMLSASPAMIPFAESCDGNRVLMASGQIKQAIPLLDAEPPCVSTGFDASLVPLLSDDFIKKTKVSGTVANITKDHISILTPDKKIVNVDIKPRLLKSGQGKNGISVFSPTVVSGQIVKKGDVIAEGSGVRDGQIALGVHMLTALMPWKGYNYEDAVVISESAAKKYTSMHILEEFVYIAEDEDVVFIADEGESFKKGDIILSYSNAVYDVESYKRLRTEGGKILNIEIYANIDKIPEKLVPAYDRFKKRFVKSNGKYPQGSFKEKNESFEGILVKFIIQQNFMLMKGDKLNNRFFNKGVVSIIEKDANMPKLPWGDRVDLILNPLGVINRMNLNQVIEMHCTMIGRKLSIMMGTETKERFMDTFSKVITLLDGTQNKQMSKSMISKFKSMSKEEYDKIKNYIYKKKFFPLVFPPFKTPKRSDILKALNVMDLSPRYVLDIPGYGKTKEKVLVGYLYETKLEHLSEKKMASRSTGKYVSRTMAPTQGKKREGGQAVGEWDLYGLLSWDCPICIEEFFGALSSDHATKNELIGDIVNRGSCEFKYPKTNPVRDMMQQYMIAIMLESI